MHMPEGTFVESLIENQKVFGAASGTLTTNLPNANYLQGLLLRVACTNGSTSNTGETVTGCITKIEVIGDGITIFSTTGRLARKLEHFDASDELPMDETQEASAVQYAVFPIKFGRHAQDKELCVPAWSLSNLQLKVTYAFTNSTTAGWTTAASTAVIDVVGRYLYSAERVNSPFLKKIETYSKTPASTGVEEVLLPVGAGNGSYRRLMLYCYEAGIQDGVDITDFQLRVNDSQTIKEDRWDTAQARNAVKYNAVHTKYLTAFMKNTDTLATFVSRIKSCIAGGASASFRSANLTAIAGDTVTLYLSDVATPTAISSAEPVRLTMKGGVVSHAVMLDLGTDNIRDSLYVGSESGISSLKLRYTVGATGGDTRVVSEQLVQY
jgi:hypothetical protein